MTSNLNKYKQDLDSLIELGGKLQAAIQHESFPEEFEEQLAGSLGDKLESYIKKLPDFSQEFQGWYSQSKSLIRQLLNDRLDDFTRHYEKPKNRKEISYENYRIEDYLQGLTVTKTAYGETKTIVGKDAAVPHFVQQLAILKSVSTRFESTLFDIKQLVQADLFDSEIDAARELLKNGFLRAAGAISAVVLEKHLGTVCENHSISTRKKNPTISDFNDLLKKEGVLDTPPWRQIQRLGDIRNLCDHNKDREPTKEEVSELIDGVDRFTKTLF